MCNLYRSSLHPLGELGHTVVYLQDMKPAVHWTSILHSCAHVSWRCLNVAMVDFSSSSTLSLILSSSYIQFSLLLFHSVTHLLVASEGKDQKKTQSGILDLVPIAIIKHHVLLSTKVVLCRFSIDRMLLREQKSFTVNFPTEAGANEAVVDLLVETVVPYSSF